MGMQRFSPYLCACLAGFGVLLMTAVLMAQRADSSGDRTLTPVGALSQSGDAGARERSFPAGSSQAQIAALREDVRGLNSLVREQNLVIEELQRQNRTMAQRMREFEEALGESRGQPSGNYATMSQVNRALEEMAENFRRVNRDQRREVIDQVTRQIDELARETQRAMDSMAREVSSAPAARGSGSSESSASSFSDDYPEEGVSYTVRSGDTLSSIASRHGARVRDIVNANRIEDPNRLRVGQTLFIPQRD